MSSRLKRHWNISLFFKWYNIASQAHDVAIKTDEISKLIIVKANEKKFIGKDETQ